MEKKLLWVINEKNDSRSLAQGSKCNRNDSRSSMRKTTLGLELRALNGKEMTLGNKLEKRLWVVTSGL